MNLKRMTVVSTVLIMRISVLFTLMMLVAFEEPPILTFMAVKIAYPSSTIASITMVVGTLFLFLFIMWNSFWDNLEKDLMK